MTIKKYFELDKNNTTINKEFLAGMTIFVAMLDNIPINATIMHAAGMPLGALITATIVMTIFATLITGLWANTPIAMSVGTLNVYFTYSLVLGLHMPWQTALGIVFISGILYVLIAITPVRRWIIDTIPLDIKRATSAGIGAFIAFIGLEQMGIIVSSSDTFVKIGNLSSPQALLGIFGLFLAIVLGVLKVRGALILSIIVTTILSWITNVTNIPSNFISMPASMMPIVFKTDIIDALKLSMLPFIITFLTTDIFSTIGNLAGIGLRINLSPKKLHKTMETDALSTAVSAIAGVASTTTFIESMAGIEEGGRTGLTAVFTALFFILPLFFLPFFEAIPGFAVYPILVVVGSYMFSELKNINYDDEATKYATFFTVLLMPLTYSITNGLMIGAFIYVLIKLFQKDFTVLKSAMGLMSLIAIVLFFIL